MSHMPLFPFADPGHRIWVSILWKLQTSPATPSETMATNTSPTAVKGVLFRLGFSQRRVKCSHVMDLSFIHYLGISAHLEPPCGTTLRQRVPFPGSCTGKLSFFFLCSEKEMDH